MWIIVGRIGTRAIWWLCWPSECYAIGRIFMTKGWHIISMAWATGVSGMLFPFCIVWMTARCSANGKKADATRPMPSWEWAFWVMCARLHGTKATTCSGMTVTVC